MLLKENDVAKANNTVRSEEISSEIWFIALSYPSLSSLLGRAVRRGFSSSPGYSKIPSSPAAAAIQTAESRRGGNTESRTVCRFAR